MATIPKRPLTQEEKADAKRLKAAWESFRAENKGVTQDWLGDMSSLGGQSAIGQYLNGVIQLNHKALFSICKVIGVDPATISPTLTAKIPAVGHAPPRPLLAYVDLEEAKLLTLYRESTSAGKKLIVDTAFSTKKSRLLVE